MCLVGVRWRFERLSMAWATFLAIPNSLIILEVRAVPERCELQVRAGS